MECWLCLQDFQCKQNNKFRWKIIVNFQSIYNTSLPSSLSLSLFLIPGLYIKTVLLDFFIHWLVQQIVLFVWFIWKKEWQRGRQKSFISWFTPQMPTTSTAWPDWSQEPENPSWSLTWVPGVLALGPSFAFCQEHWQARESKVGQLGLNPALHCRMLASPFVPRHMPHSRRFLSTCNVLAVL